jgi:hypothetical protein
MASINTSTPMPPTQWVKLLHMSMDWDKPSTLSRMLAPVVVNPEIVSNSASAREGIWPLIQKGRAPKKLSTTQIKATATKPSLA